MSGMEQNNNNKKIYPAFLVAPREREQRERETACDLAFRWRMMEEQKARRNDDLKFSKGVLLMVLW